MKKLHEFETLEEAKSYPYTKESMLAPDIIISKLTEFDSVVSLKKAAETDDKAAGFLLALSGSVKEFNVMDSHSVGRDQQLVLAYLVIIGAVTQGFADSVINEANKLSYPYANIEQSDFDKAQIEELALTSTTAQTKYKLTITDNPTKPLSIKIMQRIGTQEDLTPWHEIASFKNVEYKQLSYKCQIPESQTEHRELKAVSDETISMSIEAI